MFEAEAAGLRALANAGVVRVPSPICTGSADSCAFLVLEHLELATVGTRVLERLGRALAALHRTTHTHFGWHRENTLGTTPQINTWNVHWVPFFGHFRLRAQLERAVQRGDRPVLQRLGESLIERLPALFTPYQPAPSLLHGDLWQGNVGACAGGQPVVFDPAVYFGDREADLAMTELFGGFSSAFYHAYNEAWPLDAGYSVRKTLYNLYHILNHYNLFGGGYADQAQLMMEQLLSELR
jgi:fructosamine-3-kinase